MYNPTQLVLLQFKKPKLAKKKHFISQSEKKKQIDLKVCMKNDANLGLS